MHYIGCVVYLIDGYNLLHAVGLAGRTPPGTLDRARTRLLDWLADAARDRNAVLRVVFDAAATSRRSTEEDHRGVRVLFATGRTADELIEELVNADPRPDRLTVVSNDAQVQEAARRRGCGVRTCQGFTDWLIGENGAPTTPAPETEKPAPDATPDEMAAWLAAFSADPAKRQRRPRRGRR
jgi:predicted RNA-binding protein with PIN domain